jgi:hypothetical protein
MRTNFGRENHKKTGPGFGWEPVLDERIILRLILRKCSGVGSGGLG